MSECVFCYVRKVPATHICTQKTFFFTTFGVYTLPPQYEFKLTCLLVVFCLSFIKTILPNSVCHCYRNAGFKRFHVSLSHTPWGVIWKKFKKKLTDWAN